MRALRNVVAGAAVGLAFARWRRGRHGERASGGREAHRAGAHLPATPSLDEQDVPEGILIRRVRERAAVPEGVEVAMTEGAVVLFGRIARHALEPLLERVARVEGVVAVENRLTPVDDGVVQPPA